MIGKPWFWRLYVGLLLVTAAAMGAKHYELPRAIRGPSMAVLLGIQFVEAGRYWETRGDHSK